jgi:phosphate uptake regulator
MGRDEKIEKDESRKIQFSGRSSYMVALPKRWIEEMGIRAGDRVMVRRQSDSSLLITSETKGAINREEAVIKVSRNESLGSLVRKLVSVYLIGHNIIYVKSEGGLTSAQRDAIKEAMKRYLIGTEVVADSTDEMVMQVLLSYPELSVKNALKRMFLIAASMHKDSIAALKKLSKDTAKGVIKTDDEVDRFGLYVIRQLNIAIENDGILKETGIAVRRDCLDYRLIVKSVERVADHASKIAEIVVMMEERLPESIMSEIIQMSEFAINLFEESGLAVFKGEYGTADKIVEKSKSIVELQKKLLPSEKKARSEFDNILPIIVEDIRRTAEYASDIAEVVLNTSIKVTALEEKE